VVIVVDDSTALMDQAMLDALPEYSCSIPTGTTIGKRWKRGWCRCVADKIRNFGTCKIHNAWKMGEYKTSEEPGWVDIQWREIIVVT